MEAMSINQTRQGSSQIQAPKPGETRASARIARSNRVGGSYNPLDFEFKPEEALADSSHTRTTIMIRNIPNKYTQATMLDMLDTAGLMYVF